MLDVAHALELDQVRKTYGDPAHGYHALTGASFHVKDNEFFTLLGPSGSGKTTLLRLLAGFEATTSGEIRLYGKPIQSLVAEQRPVNTVFQQYSLFPHMTIAQNVGFGLKMQGKPAREISARVEEMLALVKMEAFHNRLPAQLSGGQQQRVALARALAPKPKVLLLDEPLSALDLKLRQAMRLELKQLQAKTGITFVFVTHDQEEALAMSDRIAVLADGVIQQVGGPREIYDRPANLFVADFIGENNFLNVEVVSRRGATAVVRGAEIDAVEARDAAPGAQRGTLMVRPEALHLSGGPGRVRFAEKAKVLADIYLGNALTYVTVLPDGTQLNIRDEDARRAETPIAEGQTVEVWADTGAPMLLDGTRK